MVDDTVTSDTDQEQENTTAVPPAPTEQPATSEPEIPKDAVETKPGTRNTFVAMLKKMNDAARQAERSVKSERVLVLKPSVTHCTVVSALAGYNVKIKARGTTCTFIKSEVYKVPAGGGDLGIIEPPFEAIHEGDKSMYFKLCKTRLWGACPSEVLATGTLSLTEVFSSIGVDGKIGTRTVELLNSSKRSVASLTVNIHCKKGTLSHHGGVKALKVIYIPHHRPRFVEATRAEGIRLERYCSTCVKVRETLQAALQTAEEVAADVTAVETARRNAFMGGGIHNNANRRVSLPPAQASEDQEEDEPGQMSPRQRLRAAMTRGSDRVVATPEMTANVDSVHPAP